ncbi:MAG: hypothetical protein HZB92_03630 [Euryarchaeota archaeon]|nr:hypothetical protein [Euryarchaeota archaeon]
MIVKSEAVGALVGREAELRKLERALLSAAKGEHGPAEADLREAIAAFDGMRMPIESSKARYHLAGVLMKLGKPEEARTELAIAIAAFQKTGSKLWLKRCREALARFAG